MAAGVTKKKRVGNVHSSGYFSALLCITMIKTCLVSGAEMVCAEHLHQFYWLSKPLAWDMLPVIAALFWSRANVVVKVVFPYDAAYNCTTFRALFLQQDVANHPGSRLRSQPSWFYMQTRCVPLLWMHLSAYRRRFLPATKITATEPVCKGCSLQCHQPDTSRGKMRKH